MEYFKLEFLSFDLKHLCQDLSLYGNQTIIFLVVVNPLDP